MSLLLQRVALCCFVTCSTCCVLVWPGLILLGRVFSGLVLSCLVLSSDCTLCCDWSACLIFRPLTSCCVFCLTSCVPCLLSYPVWSLCFFLNLFLWLYSVCLCFFMSSFLSCLTRCLLPCFSAYTLSCLLSYLCLVLALCLEQELK